jgi:hypothetical protein
VPGTLSRLKIGYQARSKSKTPIMITFLDNLRVFKGHGGMKIQVATINPTLANVWNINGSTQDKADLLANDGRILTLPYDLRAGFANLLADMHVNGTQL